MFKILLLPFSFLYNLITKVRNFLYDTGRRGSVKFDHYIISIGNLSVGGTGKTPHIEYLIRLLKNHHNIAVLSRGYGRKTKGFILAEQNCSAVSIGDEPYQYYLKFGNEITIAVGEERALAIPTILLERGKTEIILLDDAYQHRAVRPSFSVLISDYHSPFFKDFVLPYGRLRESRKGAKRADCIVFSKCPDSMFDEERLAFKKHMLKYTKKDIPVFFTGIKYSYPKEVFDRGRIFSNKNEIILVTGIANARPLVEHIKTHFILSKHIEYSDHYFYSENDIMNIISEFHSLNKANNHILMTTEKDMVKLLTPSFENLFKSIPIFYIPMEIYFLKDKEKFDSIILSGITKV